MAGRTRDMSGRSDEEAAHQKAHRRVRHAASRGPIVVTDRGRRVAALQPFSMTGRPLPNREAAIRKRSKVPVDSAVYLSELREDR